MYYICGYFAVYNPLSHWVFLRRYIVALRGLGFSHQEDFQSLRNSLFVVMEYLGGGSLYDVILRAMSHPRKQVRLRHVTQQRCGSTEEWLQGMPGLHPRAAL